MGQGLDDGINMDECPLVPIGCGRMPFCVLYDVIMFALHSKNMTVKRGLTKMLLWAKATSFQHLRIAILDLMNKHSDHRRLQCYRNETLHRDLICQIKSLGNQQQYLLFIGDSWKGCCWCERPAVVVRRCRYIGNGLHWILCKWGQFWKDEAYCTGSVAIEDLTLKLPHKDLSEETSGRLMVVSAWRFVTCSSFFLVTVLSWWLLPSTLANCKGFLKLTEGCHLICRAGAGVLEDLFSQLVSVIYSPLHHF